MYVLHTQTLYIFTVHCVNGSQSYSIQQFSYRALKENYYNAWKTLHYGHLVTTLLTTLKIHEAPETQHISVYAKQMQKTT